MQFTFKASLTYQICDSSSGMNDLSHVVSYLFYCIPHETTIIENFTFLQLYSIIIYICIIFTNSGSMIGESNDFLLEKY